MQILNLIQGSPEWKAVRAVHFTASEAPAMNGTSKYTTRDELLYAKKTGEEKEFDDFTLKLFEKGHKIEKMARPIAEEIIGDELYPATGVETIDGIDLLSSFDGLTMDQSVIWECKSWNEGKVADVRAERVPETDFWQVIQQLLISGAEKCLYMVTDGTKDKTVYLWVELTESSAAVLLNGWKQFAKDLESYEPAEPKVKGVASAIMELPALNIQIDGNVKSSNLDLYQESAEKFIASINTDLKTDDDFATAEKTVKFCEAAEKRLEQVKGQALEQTADISELFKTINFLKEQIREKRLLCSNAVKHKKQEIKLSIATNAKNEVVDCQATANKNLGGNYVFIETDFNSAMKGKKTIESLQSAANDEVAAAKIKISELAQKIQYNLEMIPNEWDFLFADKAQIVTKDNDVFHLIVKDRIDAKKEQDKIALDKKLADEMEAENLDAESDQPVEKDDKTIDIEDEISEKRSDYPIEETEATKIKKIAPDAWKTVAESLKENGIGIKSANKIARLIVDGKIDHVMYSGVIAQ